MKKKIKDLTIEELIKICCKHRCNYCPFYLDVPWCKYDDLEHYGDEEIEVDEEQCISLKD